jgi:hypothetical protein
MFDPSNPLGLPPDHQLLDPGLSIQTFRQQPQLIKEAIQLLGVVGGRLFNQPLGDGGMS